MTDTIEIIQESPDTLIIQSNNTSIDVYEGIATGDSNDLNYTQSFTSQSDITVTHNMGKKPSVTVIDSAGDEVEGDIEHISNNKLRVIFSSSFTGTIILN